MALVGGPSAWADDDITPPKVILTTPGHVNIADGSFDYTSTDLSIGTLQLERFHLAGMYNPQTGQVDPDSPFFGTHMDNNFDIYVAAIFKQKTTWNPAHYAPNVHIGASAVGEYYSTSATLPSGNLTAQSGDASQSNLALSSGTYIYTDHDGAIYTFNPSVQAVGTWHTSVTQRVASIQYPSGMVRTFSYNSSSQLKEVADSSGYAIIFDYNGTTMQVADACGFNTSQTYVTASSTCTGATLKVTYGYTSGELTSITDVLGNTTTLQYDDYNNLTCVLPPGYSACKYNNTNLATGSYPQSQTLGDGAVWTYAVNSNGGVIDDADEYGEDPHSDTVVTDPLGKTSTYYFIKSSPTQITDANGNNTYYKYEGGANQDEIVNVPPSWVYGYGSILDEVDFPEGGKYLEYHSGPYYSLSQRTMKAKPSSGLADRVEKFVYNNCSSGVLTPTCTKPSAHIDPNNTETDYTYDAYGDVLTETGPADSNGVRPQTRNTYTMLYPQVLSSAGTLVSSAGIVKLTRSSTCQSATSANPASCVGTAAETVTTYTYGDNNLDLTSKTVAAGDNSVSATTSYTYDIAGNVTVVDGPRTDVDDRSYTTYDLAHRKVFEIGVDPDGSGPLPRVIVHHLYDVDGREYRTEMGTGNATDGSDFAMTSHKLTSYDAMDRAVQTQEVMP